MTFELHGHCTCGHIHYHLSAMPLIVHCCHCTWCQRETGSAFIINAVIENAHLHLDHGSTETINTPSASGHGQQIRRCPHCRIALWSHYRHPRLAFVRVGTLTHPDTCPPDVHIYTSTKQRWLTLPPDVPAYPEFYDPDVVLDPAALNRYIALNP